MNILTKQWIKIGSICGILGISFYLIAVSSLLPLRYSFLLSFFFGPLLSIGLVGLYYLIKHFDETPIVQIGAIFGIIAGAIVSIMLIVQSAIKEIMYDKIAKAQEELTKNTLKQILEGLNAVHLGLDVSWDIFISISIILFGISMLKVPIFGKVFSYLTVLVGLLGLVLNLWTHPIPPGSAGLFDIGPIAAIYLLILFVLMFRSLKKQDFTVTN